jgi:hypothetical protein
LLHHHKARKAREVGKATKAAKALQVRLDPRARRAFADLAVTLDIAVNKAQLEPPGQ